MSDFKDNQENQHEYDEWLHECSKCGHTWDDSMHGCECPKCEFEIEYNMQAFDLGAQARIKDHHPDHSINPFIRNSLEWKSWNAGWTDADMAITEAAMDDGVLTYVDAVRSFNDY